MINKWYVRLKQPNFSLVHWLLANLYFEVVVGRPNCPTEYPNITIGGVTKIYVPLRIRQFKHDLAQARAVAVSKFIGSNVELHTVRIVLIELHTKVEEMF